MSEAINKNELKPTVADDRRRIVMPETCPANSPVMIEEVSKDTWLVRRLTSKVRAVVLLPLEAELTAKAPAS